MKTTIAVMAALIFAPLTIACAHHSVLNYDGKVEVTVIGTVTSARYGYPHSVFRIDVEADDGSVEKWVLSTEDPRDARNLGFDDELKAIKVDDPIHAVGWPDKFKKNTIRGHQLHYPDGTVVMMRRGNYIWPRDMLAMDKMALNPDNIPAGFPSTNATLSSTAQVVSWIEEDDRLTRMAREYADGRSRLIGLQTNDEIGYPGIDYLLECHAAREGFTMTINLDSVSTSERVALDDGSNYISRYNNLLSRWWEQEHESCE
ncbi:MAG: DUF6152 family protein [Woeseiaceae bacterium]|nr:DUF6152 family protein [Woeseiaceae bacterium]